MTGAPSATVASRRRSTGARVGPLPVVNLVALEIGLGLGLALLAVDTALWWAALGCCWSRRRWRWGGGAAAG